MLTYEASESIAAPQAVAWTRLCDVASWPDWLPTVSRVEPLDGRELRPGGRFVVHQPKLRPTTWVVSELDPPRRFVWVAQAPGVRMIAEHDVDDAGPGRSRVTLRFSFAGLFGGLAGRLMRSLVERYLAIEAGTLKERSEAAAPRELDADATS